MPLERRLVTIVAADVARYSALVAEREEETLDRFRVIRRTITDPALDQAGGRIVKTMGDGLLVAFASPVKALRAVIAVQSAMADHEAPQPEARRIRFRVGVHLGDIVIAGDGILGDAVNVAARLESLAPPGGICLSRSVFEQVQGKIDAALTLLGPQQVTNIPTPSMSSRSICRALPPRAPGAPPRRRDWWCCPSRTCPRTPIGRFSLMASSRT